MQAFMYKSMSLYLFVFHNTFSWALPQLLAIQTYIGNCIDVQVDLLLKPVFN